MSPDATMGNTGQLTAQMTNRVGDTTARNLLSITAGATIHTLGAWVGPTVMTAAPFDVHGFYLSIDNDNADSRQLHDIGIGPSGSQVVVITGLPSYASDSFGAAFGSFMPLFIPRGQPMWARSQSSVASETSLLTFGLFSKAQYSSNVYRRCVSFGATPATTRGTVMNPAGANTLTSWTTQGLPAPHRIHALSLWIHHDNVNLTTGEFIFEIAVLPKGGTAGSDEITKQKIYLAADSGSDDMQPRNVGPFPFSMEEGDTLRTRGQATGTTADFSLWNVCMGFG